MTPTEALATTLGPYLFFSSPETVAFPWHAHAVVCIMIERFQDVFKQYPSRSEFPMARSASDITPKPSAPPPPPATFSTPQLRPRTTPALPKKKTYLPRLARGAARRPTPPYKICVVGETGVGKTALINRVLNDTFIEYHEPTVEQNYEKTLVLDGDVYSVEMLDTSGSHIDSPVYPKWFEWAEGFIIMINITSVKSFEQVQYWLDEISRVRSSPYPFLLVGSHMDDELNRECPRDAVENFLKSYNATYVEYSAKFPAPNYLRILTTIISEIQICRKQHPDHDKSKTPKKSSHSRPRHSKPKRLESDTQLMSLEEPNAPPVNTHKGFLLKWKEKRRKPVAPGLDDPWISRPIVSEGWIESAPEIALAELNLPSAYGNDRGQAKHLIDVECVAQGFKLEASRESVTTLYPEVPLSAVVDPIERFYQPHFVGKDHATFVGEDTDGHVIVSFLLPPTSPNSSSGSLTNSSDEWSKVIVRTKQDDQRILVPFASRKEMLKSVCKAIPSLQGVKWQEVRDPNYVDALVRFEESMGLQPKHKFGVLLCLDGQIDENQMFGNKDSTPELEQFMDMLGSKITLKGWNKFRGGLDTKGDSTGTFSYYTEFQGTEIMFHVSTLLPFQDDDIQRVERKRHIGNDIVTVIFKSGNSPFSPTMLNTKFTHIFCVVSVDSYDDKGTPHYRVAIANKPGVNPYPPFFEANKPPILEGGTGFREFLLAKLINGERAALRSPEFRNKLIRTRKSLLQELADKAK